jgi:hypothetical protein
VSDELAATLGAIVQRLERLERRQQVAPNQLEPVALVVGAGNNVALNNNAGALVTAFTLPSSTFVAGHRYVINWSFRAATTGTFWQLVRDGTSMIGTDFYSGYALSTAPYSGGVGSIYFTDSGAHVYSLAVRSQNTSTGTLFSDDGGYAAIFDLGEP